MLGKENYWFWDKCIEEKSIIKFNKYIEKNFDHYEKNIHFDPSKKHAVTKVINYGKLKNFLDPFIQACQKTANENFGYILNKLYDLDGCLLNIYNSSHIGHYDWHVDEALFDHIDIKLTLLINISTKNYTGGKLYINKGKETHLKELDKPGSALMFKSHILHKVTPVTKGERRTLTIFLKGPAFK